MWRQHLRPTWIREGDRNTFFYIVWQIVGEDGILLLKSMVKVVKCFRQIMKLVQPLFHILCFSFKAFCW